MVFFVYSRILLLLLRKNVYIVYSGRNDWRLRSSPFTKVFFYIVTRYLTTICGIQWVNDIELIFTFFTLIFTITSNKEILISFCVKQINFIIRKNVSYYRLSLSPFPTLEMDDRIPKEFNLFAVEKVNIFFLCVLEFYVWIVLML